MIMSIIAALLFIPIVLFIALGVPILIGVFVYKDAAKREDCSPILWALVAALVPSFIGLVIYLLVRNDFPVKGSGASSYRDTPEGSYYHTEYDMQAVEPHKFPLWGKILIIIIAVLVIIALASVIIGAIRFITGAVSYSSGFYY